MPSPWLRVSVLLAVALSLVSWVVFQNLGGLLAGGATDPDTEPLLVPLAVAYWPCPRPGPAPAGQLLGLRSEAVPTLRSLRGNVASSKEA